MAEDEATGRKREDNYTAEMFPPARTESIRNNLRLLTAAAVLMACLAVGYTLYVLSAVLVPLVLAFVVTYLVSPVVTIFAVKLRLGRAAGVILAMLLALGLIFLVGYLLFQSAYEAVNQWPAYEARFESVVHSVLSSLQSRGILMETDARAGVMALLPQKAGTLLMAVLGKMMAWAGALVTVMLFVFFMLTGGSSRGSTSSNSVFVEIDDRVKKYLLVKTATSAVCGLLIGLTLAFVGLDMAILFGVMAFLLNFIPTFGAIVAVLLPFLLSLVQFDGWAQPLLVLAIPSAIEVIVGSLVEPKVIGDRLHIHPVVILFSLVLWGFIWGIPGMLMAAPLTAVLKIIFSHIETTRPVADIIEGKLP